MDILLRQMDLWYRSALGKALLKAEVVELEKYLPNYLGRHLLQIGGPSEVCIFEKSPVWHAVRLSPESASVFRGPCVQGDFYNLPFLPDSMDVVLLPHVLEYVNNTRRLLEQVKTILAPEGHIVIFGFNPWSLWGLKKVFSRRKISPWRGRFRNATQICLLLKHLGYEIEIKNYIFFLPPITQEKKLKKLWIMEVIGRLFWTNCGAVYCIVAKKKEAALIPLKPVMQPIIAR